MLLRIAQSVRETVFCVKITLVNVFYANQIIFWTKMENVASATQKSVKNAKLTQISVLNALPTRSCLAQIAWKRVK